MDNNKKLAFIRKDKSQKYSKGGMVKRKHYDAGGATTVPNNTVFNAGSGPANAGAYSTSAVPGSGAVANVVGPVVGGLASAGEGAAAETGNFFQNLGSSFTAQNQFQAGLAPTDYTNYGGAQTAGLNNVLAGQGTQAGVLTQQQALANQLAGANGLGVQQGAITGLQGAAGTLGGIGAQQAATTAQYQALANGTGPNPALAQLNTTTGQNIASQAALAAGQRGAASNVGLIARQNAQQGAATQQGAVGQAATLGAQQQIAGLQGLSAQQQNEAATAQAQAGVQNQIAGIGGQQLSAQQGQLTNLGNQNIAEQGIGANLYGTATGAQNTQNSNAIANYNNAQTINAATAQNNANAVNKTTSGLVGGVGSALTALLAKGGEVQHMDSGGFMGFGGSQNQVNDAPSTGRNITAINGGASNNKDQGAAPASNAPSSAPNNTGGVHVGDVNSNLPLAGDQGKAGGIAAILAARGGRICKGPHKSHVANWLALGGKTEKVPAMVSAGEIYLNPKEVKAVQHGENPLKLGTKFKGKAKVKGDSLKNDTIPVDLDEGGVILPRHITNKMNPDKARLFVLKAMAKKHKD